MATKFATKTWDGALRTSAAFGVVDANHKVPHSGTDIITGGACYAPFDGYVTRSIADGSTGGALGVTFQIVSDDGRFVFTVGHCNTNSDAGLRRGDRVKASQTILKGMGRPSTGLSTGPHYHEQLTDSGRLVNVLDYLGKSWGVEAKPVVQAGGWDGVSTLYKGSYANDGLVYTIHVGETIWGVAHAKGVSLDQVRAWTAALAASKYAAGQLAKSGPGASWWDGGSRYFAGCTFAVTDVVSMFAAEDAKVAESQRLAAEQAEQVAAEALTAIAIATESATTSDTAEAASSTEIEWATTDARVKLARQAEAAAAAELAAGLERARAQLPEIERDAQAALSGSETAGSGALAGLLAEHPTGRKRAYYAYATAALLVSFGPDIVTAGVLMESSIPTFVAYVSLASSILLKLGTALGFVAASNTAAK